MHTYIDIKVHKININDMMTSNDNLITTNLTTLQSLFKLTLKGLISTNIPEMLIMICYYTVHRVAIIVMRGKIFTWSIIGMDEVTINIKSTQASKRKKLRKL